MKYRELLHIEMNSWLKLLYWLGSWKVVNMAVLGGKPLHCSSFLSLASYSILFFENKRAGLGVHEMRFE